MIPVANEEMLVFAANSLPWNPSCSADMTDFSNDLAMMILTEFTTLVSMFCKTKSNKILFP
jgi:hypothetical protein